MLSKVGVARRKLALSTCQNLGFSPWVGPAFARMKEDSYSWRTHWPETKGCLPIPISLVEARAAEHEH